MKYLLDGMVALLLIVTMLIGYYRGFIRYVISMLGTLVAVVLSFVLANALAEPVYERFVQTSVTTSIETAIDKIDVNSYIKNELESLGAGGLIDDSDIENIMTGSGTISENLNDALIQKGADTQTAESLSGKFKNWFTSENISEKIDNATGTENNTVSAVMQGIEFTAAQLDDAVKNLALDKTAGAKYLETEIVKPIAVPIVKVFLFFACVLIIALVIKLILFVSGVFTKLPPISVANHFAGMLLGAVKGMLYVTLIAFMLCIVVNSTADSLPTFNSKVADSTYVFKYFFDFFYK